MYSVVYCTGYASAPGTSVLQQLTSNDASAFVGSGWPPIGCCCAPLAPRTSSAPARKHTSTRGRLREARKNRRKEDRQNDQTWDHPHAAGFIHKTSVLQQDVLCTAAANHGVHTAVDVAASVQQAGVMKAQGGQWHPHPSKPHKPQDKQ